MSLLLKVACPDCATVHEAASLGAEVRCRKCGRDFRAKADGESASQILSVTPDELDNVPYSQRSIEVPVNSVSSIIVADPMLISDKLLRDAPLKENAKWVGKVRLVKKLGQGGMGAVYRGYDESLALDVAVKILPVPTGARDEQFVQRFRQEARISAQINHPNVVRTLHVDEQGDLIYLVMDYIEGQTARTLVDSKGPLAVPLALQIMQDAARGVHAAHSHNVIHRDIKPDNILVADDGRVLISDLGLAKARISSGSGAMPVTRMGLLLGTPEYMSPEQWEIGADIGTATDIWSLGATLWMLLTHQPPFVEKDLGLLARKVKELPLPDIRALKPNVPDSVLEILDRCLAKKPHHRYGDCAALIDAINSALSDIAAGKATVTARPAAEPVVRSVHASPPPMFSAPPPMKPLAPLPAPQPAKPLLAEPRPVVIHGQSPKTKLWVAAAVVIAMAAVVLSLLPKNQPAPPPQVVVAPPVVSMTAVYPAEVKAGEDAELRAVVSGADAGAYTITWTSGDKSFTGAQVKVPLQNDSKFVVAMRENKTQREIERKEFKISVELEARAAEKDFFEIETGTPLKFEGAVRGGESAGKIETRWVDLGKPQQPVSDGLLLELQENGPYSQPGRYTFVFQAKRKEQLDWSGAATDKVVVQVDRKVPSDFKNAMNEGLQARERALQARTGAIATAHWKDALACFERANQIFPDDDAAAKFEQCRQKLELEDKYANFIEEAKRLKQAAEAIPASDGVRRLAAWSEALRPWTAARVLFDRAEAREQSAVVEAKLREQRALLENAEQERATFEALILKARSSTREAKKYLSPSVALPHWEDALGGFTELSRQFPRRSDEFALELKEAQENRDKAYLEETLGVVPVKAGDRPQNLNPPAQPLPPETPAPPKPAPAPSPSPAPPAGSRLPEPRSAPR